jgi:membrane carboxypeptidase/penicillin-binding protein
MDTWFVGYTSRWMTTTWMGDDLRRRPLGLKDAAFMLTVPMFARYMTEVTAGQPLQDIPWSRPKGVKAGDTGGKLRTTVEEVLADAQADAGKPGAGGPGNKGKGQTKKPAPPAPKSAPR